MTANGWPNTEATSTSENASSSNSLGNLHSEQNFVIRTSSDFSVHLLDFLEEFLYRPVLTSAAVGWRSIWNCRVHERDSNDPNKVCFMRRGGFRRFLHDIRWLSCHPVMWNCSHVPPIFTVLPGPMCFSRIAVTRRYASLLSRALKKRPHRTFNRSASFRREGVRKQAIHLKALSTYQF